MQLTKNVKAALLNHFMLVGTSLSSKNVSVNEILANKDELGYTLETGTDIFLSFSHPYYENLTTEQTLTMIKGIFSHELLHVLITDFSNYQKAIKNKAKKSLGESQIFAQLLNICEDAAIEFFAPQYLSRDYVKTLEFTRAVLYKNSPNIETLITPIEQFFSALLQFRWFGYLKGSFTNQETKSAFLNSVDIFILCNEEPNQQKRIAYAEQILEISRPLWKDASEAADKINDMMKKLSISRNNGQGTGSEQPEAMPSDNSELSKRRKITIRKVSQEELEKASEGAKNTSDKMPDGDIEVLVSDKPLFKQDKTEEKNNNSLSIPSSSATETPPKKTKEDTKEDTSLNKTNDEIIDHTNTEINAEKELSDEIKNKTLSKEELMAIEKMVEDFINNENKEQTESLKIDESLFDLPVKPGYKNLCKNVSCQNIWVDYNNSPTAQLEYADVVKTMSSQINNLVAQLKHILKNKQEENVYKESGKVSLKRLSGSRLTSRIFTKRRLPAKDDIAIMIAVDISGSMHGSKIRTARNTAIALAEVFGKLNIPTYMFGFTAQENDYAANHKHYVNWSNRPKERLRLLSMKSTNNNFDGYSIRYATELLKRKDAEKKILFVISDGLPACRNYRSLEDGLMDVQLAVSEARKTCLPIGILLGTSIQPEIHRKVYGYGFVHCKKNDELFLQLSKLLKKYV